MNRAVLTSILVEHEGLRFKPYRDTKGNLTIGVGRNLDSVGISQEEAMYLLDNDIDVVLNQLSRFPWYAGLTDNRQYVICDMVFNMGLDSFKGFKGLIIAIENGNFDQAAAEIEDSLYFKEGGMRAIWARNNMRDG